jgi:protein-tyrosine-phosphatase
MRAEIGLCLVLMVPLAVACNPGASSTTPPSTNAAQVSPATRNTMHPALLHSLEALASNIEQLPAERRETLDRLAQFVRAQKSAGKPVRLTFICTGNSRRSHLGQLWAAAVARYYGIDGVETFSGGTEPSAFNPRTLAAVERAGFVVERPEPAGDNPHYRISYAADVASVESFSKRFDDASNPSADFAAVMTCTEADQGCPFVPGAALRISLPYDDPKVADDTPEEAARYDERSRQIATEMLYLFSRVAAS